MASDTSNVSSSDFLNRAARRAAARELGRESDGPQGASPTIVAVDELAAQLVRVTARDGSTLDLWDDIPTHRMLFGMRLLDISARQEQAARAGDADAFSELCDERDRETLAMATVVVRHSYPEYSREDVARLLSPDTQEAMLGHFFTRRLLPYLIRQRALLALANDTDASNTSNAVAAAAGTETAATATEETTEEA